MVVVVVVVVMVEEPTMPSNSRNRRVQSMRGVYIDQTSREQQADETDRFRYDKQSDFDCLEIEVRVESWWRRGRPKNKQTTKGGKKKKKAKGEKQSKE